MEQAWYEQRLAAAACDVAHLEAAAGFEDSKLYSYQGLENFWGGGGL
jgi:hypothetical protein